MASERLKSRFRNSKEDIKLVKSLLDSYHDKKFCTNNNFQSVYLSFGDYFGRKTNTRWGTKVKPHIEFCIKTLKMQFQTVHEMFIRMNSGSFSGDPKKKIAAVEKAIWNAYIQVCKLFNCNNLIMMILGYLSFMLLFIVAFAVDFFVIFFTICCYFTCYLQLFYSLVAIIF